MANPVLTPAPIAVQTANLVRVELANVQIGLIQSIRMSDSYGLEAVMEVGNIDPREQVPTRATYRLSVSGLILKTSTLRSLGIVPKGSSDVLKGLVFDAVVYGVGVVGYLRKYTGCSYDSGDIEVSANRIIVASGQFAALGVSGSGL